MSPKTPGRLVAVGIVAFWATMTGMLLRREVFLPRLDAARVRVPGQLAGLGGQNYQEDWQGIYYKDAKVGYAHSQVHRLQGDTYLIRNDAALNLRLLDRDMSVQFEGFARVDAAGQPEELLYAVVAGPAQLRVRGHREGDTLVLQVVSAGRVIEKRVPITPGMSLSNAITPSLYWPELEMGRTYTLEVLDPVTLSTQDAKVRVRGREPLDYRGATVETTVVEFETSQLAFRIWVSDAGVVLRQESDLGWYLIREDRETVKQGLASGPVLERVMREFATVSSNRTFMDPQQVSFLRARLVGVDPHKLDLAGAQQTVVPGQDAVVEIVRRWPRPAETLPLPIGGPAFAPYLESTPLIQSDDPAIVAQARRIIGDDTNSWRAAKRIRAWVYDNIEKELVASIPSAVEVLEVRQGDCNEHTTLFTALARAVGIPTRVAVGIVYNGGRYFYHAWPEVYVGEWVAMDPTFGQDVADATHIKLLEGDLTQQARLMTVLGRLKIEVLDDSEHSARAEQAAL